MSAEAPGAIAPLALALLSLALLSPPARAEEPPTDPGAAPSAPLEIPLIQQPPSIDGHLDDPAWQTPPLPLGEWLAFQPTPGAKMGQQTEVWAAHDDEALYFAFLAHDTEPGKVRSHLGRRDQIYQDDTVGVAVDSLGTSQLAYEMYANAHGVQLDLVTTHSTGSTDEPDWRWESAGRRTPEGFVVEIRLPLASIRFKAGAEVQMGMIFWRNISRLGQAGSWPTLSPGRSQFEIQAPVILRDLKPARLAEVVPSLTYGWSSDRESAERFAPGDSQPDAGLSAKLSMGPGATADLTVNPDFSQVESDAYQIEVNQRYPLFYSEKRPFFMEGMTAFQLAGAGGDANMRTAVHTRRIVDPDWGAKFTGGRGNLAFVTLHAGDRLPNTDDPISETKQYYNVGRLQWGFGRLGNAGLLAASTIRGNDFNHVAGADLALQGRRQALSLAILTSHSRDIGDSTTTALAGHARYSFRNRRYELTAFGEHFDRDFRMDTAFMNQVGLTNGWAFASVSAYPRWGSRFGLQRIRPFVFAQAGRDREQGGDRRALQGGVNLNFTRSGYLRLDATAAREPWAEQEFDTRRLRAIGQVQPTRWLGVNGSVFIGRGIYYDPQDPFVGDTLTASASVSLQPTGSLNLSLGYDRSTFDHAETGERVYAVDVFNTRATYQFDRRLAVRAVVQYDSSLEQVLTDFLASFELVPGSVAYLGYGSLYERREWVSDLSGAPGASRYLEARRGLFFKLSYAHRF
jgi:hypothetical protein